MNHSQLVDPPVWVMENIMYIYISNAFATNMLSKFPVAVSFVETSPAHVASMVRDGAISSVGHESTAAVFSKVLGVKVPMQRSTIELQPGDSVIVGSYKGPRLEEGATELPEGATIVWLIAWVNTPKDS